MMLAVCLGCGLAIECATRVELPETVLFSVGLEVIMVVARLAVDNEQTVVLATPVTLVISGRDGPRARG